MNTVKNWKSFRLEGSEAVEYAKRAHLGFTDPEVRGHLDVLVAIDDAKRNPLAEHLLARTIELSIRD